MLSFLFLLAIQSIDSQPCSPCREGLTFQDYADIQSGQFAAAPVSCGDADWFCSIPEHGCFQKSCAGATSLCFESCEHYQTESEAAGCCGWRDGCRIQIGIDRHPRMLSIKSIAKLSATIEASGCDEVQMDALHINWGMPNLKGLEKISHVGDLQIKRVLSLEGLSGLKTAGQINIQDTVELASMQGLAALRFACSLSIDGNLMLASLQGLESLQSLGGCVLDQPLPVMFNLSTPVLAHLSLPTARDQFALTVRENPMLTSLQGLDSLVRVTGIVAIRNNDRLTSLQGLESLTAIAADWSTVANAANAGLEVSDNQALTSLRGLEALERIDSNMVIRSNSVLMSLGALDGVSNFADMTILVVEFNDILCPTTKQRQLYELATWPFLQNCSCLPGFSPNAHLCTFCPAGAFCLGGETAAQACPLGSNATGGQPLCECTNGFEPNGSSPDKISKTWNCKKCQDYATSAGNNGLCFCDRAKHAVEDYLGDLSTCACPKNNFMNRQLQRCQECRMGERCDWDIVSVLAASTVLPPVLEPGYWAEKVLSLTSFSGHSVWRCYSSRTCIGNSTCAAHRTGIVCGDCLPGFHGGPNGPCSPCRLTPASHRGLLAGVMGAIALVALLLLQTGNVLRARAKGTTALSQETKRILRSIKQLIKYFQILDVVYVFKIAWPFSVLQFYDILRRISLTFEGVLQEQCLAYNHSVELLIYYRCTVPLAILCMVMASVPLARAISVVLAWVPCRRFRQLAPHAPILASDASQFAFQVFSVLFISILKSATSLLRCRDNPNSIWVVQDFPQIECYTDRWLQSLPAVAVAVFLYVLCYVIALIYIVRKCKKSLQTSQGKNRGTFSFIVEDFRNTQIIFPIVMISKDIAINIAALLPLEAEMAFSLLILTVYMLMVLKESPFEDPVSNNLELWLNACLTLQIAVAGCMGLSAAESPRIQDFFIVLFFACLAPAAALLILQVMLALPCFAEQVPVMLKPLSAKLWSKQLRSVFRALDHSALEKMLSDLDPVERSRVCKVLITDALPRPSDSPAASSPEICEDTSTSQKPSSKSDSDDHPRVNEGNNQVVAVEENRSDTIDQGSNSAPVKLGKATAASKITWDAVFYQQPLQRMSL